MWRQGEFTEGGPADIVGRSRRDGESGILAVLAAAGLALGARRRQSWVPYQGLFVRPHHCRCDGNAGQECEHAASTRLLFGAWQQMARSDVDERSSREREQSAQ